MWLGSADSRRVYPGRAAHGPDVPFVIAPLATTALPFTST